MLRGLEASHRDLARLLRPRRAAVIVEPARPPVEVEVGDVLHLSYGGELRRIQVLAILPWGLRGLDLDRSGWRSFRFDRIGVAPPQDAADDGAAS